MNDYGLEMLRHNNWANLGLIEFCASLPEERLDASAPGTYGRIRETLVHMVAAQERYVKMLSGKPPSEATVNERNGWPGLTALREITADSGRTIEELAEKGQSGWSFRYQSLDGKRWSTLACVLFCSSRPPCHRPPLSDRNHAVAGRPRTTQPRCLGLGRRHGQGG